MEWDVFISHASKDKRFVRKLASALRERGLRVWYDEFTLSVGESLSQSIDRGLANSHYGIVILSLNFFKRSWPQKELGGLVAREVDGKKVILPVWYHITEEEVRRHSPTLADRVAISTDQGLERVVEQLLKTIQPDAAQPADGTIIRPQPRNWFSHLLRDPIWQGVSALVAVIALGWAVYAYFASNNNPITSTPTREPTQTATEVAVDLDDTDTPVPPTPTKTPDVIGTEFAIRQAIDATNTALAPTPTHTPTPTDAPMSTDTPTSTPTVTPTNTPLPPPPPPTSTPTDTPTPTPPPTGKFSFSASVDGSYRTYIYDLSTSTSESLYVHNDVVDADLQPGGNLLAYRWAAPGRGGIWRMELNGANQQEVTTFVEDRAPSWSADGTGIFLSSSREGNHSVSYIFRIFADGSELRFGDITGRHPIEFAVGRLLYAGWLSYSAGACGIIYYPWERKGGTGEILGTEGRVSDRCSDNRPDAVGNQVVFMRQEGNQPFDIWRNQMGVGLEGAAINMTPDTPDSNDILPVFAPDGQWIAFASNRGGRWNIYVMKADGTSEPTILVATPLGSDFSDWELSRLSWAN